MEMTNTKQEIEQRINDVHELTKWSPVPSGSVLRVHAYSYPAWGITITPENSEWIYSTANAAYSVEWKDTDKASNDLVAQASVNAGLSDVNAVLNENVGFYAAERIFPPLSRNNSFTLIDIGCGPGATTLATLNSLLDQGAIPNPDWILKLVEPSEKRLVVARDAIVDLIQKRMSNCGMPSIICIPETDIVSLSSMISESADLAISNASVHHNSFNSHLLEINRVLKPGTPFINGDWHNSMWETPARTYWLLYLLQNLDNLKLETKVLDFVGGKTKEIRIENEIAELKEFRKYFSLGDEKTLLQAFGTDCTKEREANAGIIKFWLEVGRLFSGKCKRSPIFFLESHERISKRLENLKNACFVFDPECNKKYKEVLRKKGKGELATVMVAKKRC